MIERLTWGGGIKYESTKEGREIEFHKFARAIQDLYRQDAMVCREVRGYLDGIIPTREEALSNIVVKMAKALRIAREQLADPRPILIFDASGRETRRASLESEPDSNCKLCNGYSKTSEGTVTSVRPCPACNRDGDTVERNRVATNQA